MFSLPYGLAQNKRRRHAKGQAMNRETIIQMAREAGLAEVTDTAESLPADYVEALAKLCALSVAKEREECAKWYAERGWLLDEEDVPAAIRARGEAA